MKYNFILAVIFATALFTGTTTHSEAQTQSGVASVYTTKHDGTRTASGRRLNDGALTAAGWTVVRIWEHEPIDRAVELVETALADRTS